MSGNALTREDDTRSTILTWNKGRADVAIRNLKWIVIIDCHNSQSQQYIWNWDAKYDGQVLQDLLDAHDAFGR